MSQNFKTPIFSDTEFKYMKEILPYSSSNDPVIENVQRYLEKAPQGDYEDSIKKLHLLICSLREQENITGDDLNNQNKLQITLVTPNPGQDFDTNSPQCQALVSNLDSQLKEQIAKLVEENNQLKQKVQRQAEQFREISALADQLINPSA